MNELTQQDRTRWRELISKQDVITRIFEHVEEATPQGFNPDDKTPNADSVALRSAWAEGWRQCLKFIRKDCTQELTPVIKASFQDMSDTSEN